MRFLSDSKHPSGNYTSLNLTFSNPELTFRNDTGTTLADVLREGLRD